MKNKSIQRLDNILSNRGKTYNESWKMTGIIYKYLNNNDYLEELHKTNFTYNWITILCKLMRLLANPYHEDSWLDIAGYAIICLDECNNEDNNNNNESDTEQRIK